MFSKGLEKLRIAGEDTLALQRDRLILWLPVGLGCGIGTYFGLRFEPPAILAYGAAFCLLALWGALWPLRRRAAAGMALWLAVGALTLFAGGFAAAKFRTDFLASPVITKEIRMAEITGTVTDIDMLEEGDGVRILLEDLEIEKLPPEKTPKRVRLRVRLKEDEAIPPLGSRVEALAGLNAPSAPVAPRSFDFQRYAWFKQIGAFGFTYRAPSVIGDADEKPSVFSRLRVVIEDKVRAALSPRLAAIAEALLTAERAGIEERDNQAMRDAGLAHMLAISGLHIGLVAGSVFMVLRFIMALFPGFALRHPIKKYAAVFALLAAIFYTVLAGAPVPAVRATIMTGIVLAAVMLDRVAISLRLVALAACAVLLGAPESLVGASFQMSFAAVTGLIFFYEMAKPYLSSFYRKAGFFRRLCFYFVGVCMTTVIATLATAPFSLFHFQNLALYSLFSNLLAMPLLTFIVMPSAVLAFVLMPLGLAHWPLVLMGRGIEWILDIAHATAALPQATWTPAAWPVEALAWMSAGFLFFIIWRGRGRYLALLPLIISMIMIFNFSRPDILVSSSGKLMALRMEDGVLSLSNRRSDRFAAESWAQENGHALEEARRWSDEESILCDNAGCRTVRDGKNISFVFQSWGIPEDCAWADILVSARPVARDCKAPVAIGLYGLMDDGAYALWIAQGRVESVASRRGNRPWAVSNRR